MPSPQLKKNKPTVSLIAVLIIGILLFSTLPRGGNFPWFILLLTCLMSTAGLIYLFKERPLAKSNEQPWLLVWLVYTAVILAQLFVIPRIVNWNSPSQEIINLDNYPVNTPAILESWVRFTCYWLITFFVSNFNSKAVKYSIMAIFAVLAFQVVYGVLANSLGQSTIIGIWPKEHYLTSATGSFVNHNHYANYIALATPLVVGYFLPNNGSINQKKLSTSIRYGICITLLLASLIALVSSLSRGGILSGLAGYLFLLSAYIFKGNSINGKTILLALFIACLFLITAMSFIELDNIIARFIRAFIYDMRWEIWQSTLDLPKTLWLFGSGGGTFADIFWRVHPATTPKTAFYAHNDYIQFLIEYGILGTIFICSAFFYWFKKTHVRKLQFTHIACLISILVMALHSVVDFSLHIPANAILFWFCVGLLFNNNLNMVKRKRVTKFTTTREN